MMNNASDVDVLDVFRQERDRMEIVRSLQKRVEDWAKNGRDVSMNVENGTQTVDIVIRLKK